MSKIARRPTKKEQILSLYLAGAKNVGELATMTQSRPSYVAEVLRQANALGGYFDLYTTTEQPMNIYSSLFAKRLSFRTEPLAASSVRYIDSLYRHFERLSDRAGQHHALMMALTMFNRARWSNKLKEANIFRRWLMDQLNNFQLPDNKLLPPAYLKHGQTAVPAQNKSRHSARP